MKKEFIHFIKIILVSFFAFYYKGYSSQQEVPPLETSQDFTFPQHELSVLNQIVENNIISHLETGEKETFNFFWQICSNIHPKQQDKQLKMPPPPHNFKTVKKGLECLNGKLLEANNKEEKVSAIFSLIALHKTGLRRIFGNAVLLDSLTEELERFEKASETERLEGENAGFSSLDLDSINLSKIMKMLAALDKNSPEETTITELENDLGKLREVAFMKINGSSPFLLFKDHYPFLDFTVRLTDLIKQSEHHVPCSRCEESARHTFVAYEKPTPEEAFEKTLP